MQQFRCAVFLALLAGAAVAEVTPIEKVVTLIEGLKSEVEKDGTTEGKAYEEFACFCKDTTKTKSDNVKRLADKIERLSADIADKTQEKKTDSKELMDRKQKHEELNAKLEETTVRCAKQKAEYEAEAADMSKAIQGLKDAIKAMKTSMPSMIEIKKSLGKTFQMAEAMSLLSTPKHKAVAAFVQESTGVDPNDPEYNFHSNDIISTCEELLVDYKGSKKDLDDEWAKTKKACDETKASLNKRLSANTKAMKQLEKDIDRLKKEIANHRISLVESDGMLKDDEQYLKDLTARCEDRANDYDQRSAMRADELSALTKALKVLKGTVQSRTEVNARALLQAPVIDKPASDSKIASPAAPKASASTVQATLKSISFLQKSAVSEEGRRVQARDVLRMEGDRLGSVALTSLAERVAADPFKKIKGLIQKLIERLLTEAKNEATKKGFCDTELGKARKDRDFRWQEANDLSADLAGLEAKQDELVQEIKELTKGIKEEELALKKATEEREAEKKANMETLKTAKEGLEGMNEALLILRSFFKQAATGIKPYQSFVQASPVDEDTSGPGFSGDYKGSQDGMKAVFALLETIQSDFDRTIRKTEEAEAAAHRDYVEFQQTADASLAGKKTKKELDEQDLKTTKTSLATKMDGYQTAVDLLDSALLTLEDLKPACIDTGMSYSERVKKREEEMKALGKALCILDADNVEPECSGK